MFLCSHQIAHFQLWWVGLGPIPAINKSTVHLLVPSTLFKLSGAVVYPTVTIFCIRLSCFHPVLHFTRFPTACLCCDLRIRLVNVRINGTAVQFKRSLYNTASASLLEAATATLGC